MGGHFYSDKPFGTVAVALPAFWLSAKALKALGIPLDSEAGWLVTSWAACAWALGLPAALGATALFMWARRFAGARPALAAVLCCFLGLPLAYTGHLFSHALVVGLLGIAIWAADLFGDGKVASWRLTLAGFSLGLALASEFTAGLLVVGIAAFIGAAHRNWWPLLKGAALPLVLIPAYNWACVGSPFRIPYSLQETYPQMREGLYAIKWPDPETAYRLLIDPARGLFFWQPFLLIAAVGYWQLAGERQRWLWLLYGLPVLQVVVISGRTWDWPAGCTLGPRYLLPIIPLLVLPCAVGLKRLPILGGFAGLYSVALASLATLTDAAPGYEVLNPATELHLPMLARGDFGPNLGRCLGLSPWASVVLFYVALAGGVWCLWRQAKKLDGESPLGYAS